MKHAAEYAKRIKRLFNQLRRQHGKPEPPDALNPLEHLILSVLARGTSDAKARAAYDRLRESMVDNNELRVTPSNEVADLLGTDLPDRAAKARSLIDSLNAVYDRQNAMDLSFLKGMSVRDARDCLRSLGGVDEFAAARVVLFSLGGHAVPVDEHTAYVLRKEEFVSPDATIDEIQAFLERQVHASEAMTVSILLHRYAATRSPKPEPKPAPKPEVAKPAAEVPEKVARPSPAKAAPAAHKSAEAARTPPSRKEKPAGKPALKSKTART